MCFYIDSDILSVYNIMRLYWKGIMWSKIIWKARVWLTFIPRIIDSSVQEYPFSIPQLPCLLYLYFDILNV